MAGVFETMYNKFRWCPAGTGSDAAGEFGCRHGWFCRDAWMVMGLADSSSNNEKFETQYPRKRVISTVQCQCARLPYPRGN